MVLLPLPMHRHLAIVDDDGDGAKGNNDNDGATGDDEVDNPDYATVTLLDVPWYLYRYLSTYFNPA